MEKLDLLKIKNIQYKIISLGINCLPRSILTRWGLKPSKAEFETTMPFDLAVFETREITKNLNNDFKDFTNNISFKNKKHLFDKEYWIKEPDLIKFIHEKNFGKNDESKLINSYYNRINNFRECIKSNPPILFVQLIWDSEDVNNLYNILKNIRGNKPFKLVVIDTQNIVSNPNSEIEILKLKFPTKNYNKHWWHPRIYKSKKGQDFERKIAEFCFEKIIDFEKLQ